MIGSRPHVCRLAVRLCSALLFLVCQPLFAQQFDPSLYAEMKWRMIGPFRGGRTVAVTGVPGEPNLFYIAAVNGGVWKTTDFGRTWNPIFDGQPTGSVGAIAVAPSNSSVIYVGSGEGLQRPDLATGNGIYKSTDAGATWQHLKLSDGGPSDGQQIGSIIVDPRDPNRVLVAVLGHPYGPNQERGVFRSTDGGQSWEKVLYKDENTGAIQVAFDPSNPQIVYADLWVARRPPWTTGGSMEGPGSGLYKSTDGGSTWRELTEGLPSPSDGRGRIGIGIARSDPNRIYALVDSPKLGGLYRSDNAGESWRRVNTEQRIWGRGDDFAGVTVDPRDENRIYVANTSTYRSTDGGEDFTAIKGAPGGDDYHTVWINPDDPDIILLGSDQGATISVNGGRTWSSWYNQPTAQFYHVITDNRFPYWVYGGQQESGSAGVASRGNDGAITFREFHPVGVEEYGYVAPDPLHPNLIYGGKVTRFDWETGQTTDVSPVVLRSGKFRFNRTMPLVFSPVDPHVLYFSSQVLFKTTNGGESWQTISVDLTRGDPGIPPNLGIFASQVHEQHRGVIYTIAPSFQDVKTIWVGTDDGLIHLTGDGGLTWQNVTPPELTAWSKVAMIEASHFDNASAYAAVNRFRLDDLHPYVYRTHDGGKTWQKIVDGLPGEPVNTVREDPVRKGLLFAGTEGSVYVSFDDGDHWQSLQLNLPHTSMRDLTIHQDDLVVGTHGRSFWILDDFTPLRQLSAAVADAEAHLFRPEVAYRVQRDTNTDTPLPPDEPAGQNPPDGAVLDYHLKSAASGPVTLEVVDRGGKLVRRFASTDKPEEVNPKELEVPLYWVRPPHVLSAAPGMHRFVWDLHYPPPDSLYHEYPISAIVHDTPRYPLGPVAVPGEYTVKLTVGGKEYSQPLTVNMDPRVKASPADLAKQFALEARIVDAMQQDFESLQRVNGLRSQLKNLQSQKAPAGQFDQAGQSDKSHAAGLPQDVVGAIEALDRKAAAIAGGDEEFDFFSGVSGGGGENLTRLNGELDMLLASVSSADAAPTSQVAIAFSGLAAELQKQMRLWGELKSRDVAALNQKLKHAGLQELTIVD
ncbi:MAG TPA: glycoside hydrolase [Terriglobia bacterium]|nr:glycoside hydrolase [Terriglobia bacterium]